MRMTSLRSRAPKGTRTIAWRATTVVICCGITLLFASVASASADSLATTVTTATPEQAVPVTLQFNGSTTHNAQLLAVARPAGGIPCQSTYENDESGAGNANEVLFGHGSAEESGSFSEHSTYTPENPGGYVVCAWLESTDGSDTVFAGPIATSFTARGPQVAQLTIALASVAIPNKGFQLNYTTQTDQQLQLLSVIKPAGGLPCAASYELETQQNQTEDVIFGHGSADIFGGPTTTTATDTEEKAGPYLVCAWVEGPNSSEVDASNAISIYVGSPPAPPACKVPKVATGTTLNKAKASIVAAHCSVGAITYAYSRTVLRGEILSLSPASGSVLGSGAPVALRVSAGPPPAPCRVPSIRPGSTLRSAKRAIIAHHCSVGLIERRYNGGVVKGRVIGVTPRPGTLHPAAKRVTIIVSAGRRR